MIFSRNSVSSRHNPSESLSSHFFTSSYKQFEFHIDIGMLHNNKMLFSLDLFKDDPPKCHIPGAILVFSQFLLFECSCQL